MKVIRAKKLGFCFGVQNAVKLAEVATEGRQPVYSLGPIIHNNQVVDHLAKRGLKTVDSPDEVQGGTVLIRAHGAGPQTMALISQGKNDLINTTCTRIRRAQEIVRKLHDDGFHVVIVGDPNHAEVSAVAAYAPDVTVINSPQDVDRLSKRGKLGIIAQTTYSQQHLATIIGLIVLRPFTEIRVVNTLCPEVARRQQAAVALCSQVNVMFVLGGHHSANTTELVRLCREQGTPTHHLESWDSFRPEFVRGCKTAGVTAGASTAPWVIDEFVANLEAL